MRRSRTGDGDGKSIPSGENSMARLAVSEEGLGSLGGAERAGAAPTRSARTGPELQGVISVKLGGASQVEVLRWLVLPSLTGAATFI